MVSLQTESCILLIFIFRNDIRSVLNLQKPGEHAECGEGLEKAGFSYDPQIFMENNSKFSFISTFRHFNVGPKNA